MMQRWLEFLETKSEKNLLTRWGGEWDFLGDWVWPGARDTNGETRETLFFNNCYWVYNLKTAAKIAGVLGKADIADFYHRRADEVRGAVHNEFFDPQANGYLDKSQVALAIALVVDLPPAELRAKIEKRFENEVLIHRGGHFWGGITGGYFIFQQLLKSQRNDLAYVMVSKTDFPSWGDMLRQGATTFWETWEGDLSRLHSSYLHVGAWFMEGLAGIVPDDQHPGYKHFFLRPAVLDEPELTWVRASYESPYGLIRSEWRVEGNQLEIKVTVPPNSRASLTIPTIHGKEVVEGDSKASEARGVSLLQIKPDRVEYMLESGDYAFKAPR
jgi:alpha-L-rhamnosidase